MWIILGASLGGLARDFAIGLLNRSASRPVYLYVHNISWVSASKNSWLFHWIFGVNACYIVLTENIRQTLVKSGLRSRVLRNTLTSSELTGVTVTRKAKRLLWVSAVTVEKGFDTAYAAFLLLKHEDPEWMFDVYGKGLSPENYSQAAFRGLVSGESKAAAFAAGGVFLLPSCYVNETQPLCLIEALSVGMPVVASDIGGIPEVVGESASAAGIVLRNPTPSSVASAVKQALSGEVEFGEAGKIRYAELFSADAFDRSLEVLMGHEPRAIVV